MLPIRVNSCAIAAIVALSACNANNNAAARDTTPAAATPSTSTVSKVQNDSLVARADNGRVQGNPASKIWLVIVSDFQCPYCKQWHDSTFEAVRKEYVTTGKVRMAYVNFPLASHQFAWPSAHSAMCASEQGKFWEYQDSLFSAQQKWEVMQDPAPLFDSLARDVRLDMTQWRDCVKSGRMQGLISTDRERATQAGVNSTPSFLVGPKGMAGVHPIEDFRKLLDPAIAAAGKTN
jgi:protein-disulfide isomerase